MGRSVFADDGAFVKERPGIQNLQYCKVKLQEGINQVEK